MIKRREIKFRLQTCQSGVLEKFLISSSLGFIKHFPDRAVNSVYFDDSVFNSACDNLLGNSRRTKRRYRWYGSFEDFCFGTFELKQKDGLDGWKENHSITLSPSLKSFRELKRELISQLPISENLIMNTMSPEVLIKYNRKYYISFDGSVRLTVDSDVAYWKISEFNWFQNKKQTANDLEKIIEIKYDSNLENIVSGSLHELMPILSRNSKYTKAVTRLY